MSDNKDKQTNQQPQGEDVAETTATAEATEQTAEPKAKGKKKKSESEIKAELEQKIQTLESKLLTQNDVYLRMLAEYDNYRKRSAADSERQKVVGITQTLTAVFPVIDSVNRALEVLKEDDKAQAGILQIKKQFEQAMQKIGVEQIPALGEEFNPEVHNAVMQEENAEQAGKVVQVFQEGYRYKEYVIRPSMVKVAV